jgi:hypothetical protein
MSTKGGTTSLDKNAYESWYCTPFAEDDYTGIERTLIFQHPGEGKYVDITLESPCADMDLFVYRWESWHEDGVCPTDENTISECEVEDSGSGGTVSLYQSRSAYYMITVEAREGVEDIFRLSVECP